MPGWWPELRNPTAGLFGHSHLTGGYADAEAGHVRVLVSDVKAMLLAATP